jgi:hypothetical protein
MYLSLGTARKGEGKDEEGKKRKEWLLYEEEDVTDDLSCACVF